MTDTTYSIRIDSELKAKAQEVAKAMGLPLSSVVRSCLANLVETKEIDFCAEKPSQFLIDSIKEAIKDEKEGNLSPAFDNVDEAIKWLES